MVSKYLTSFFLPVPKKFENEPFCIPESFQYRKFLWIKGRYYQEYQCKSFCLTVPKNSVEETFCVSKTFRCQKIFSKKGGTTVISLKFVVWEYRKNLQGPSVFQKKSGIESLHGHEVITIFSLIFLLTEPENFCSGSHLWFGKNSGIENHYG